MGDPAADPGRPSAAALAAALGRADEAGLLAAYDAYGPDLVAYAGFLLGSEPGSAEPDLGPERGAAEPAASDQAGDAVVDALLVATGAVAELADPGRMRPWLLALTRNECLRRRPGAAPSASSADEAAELGRRGLRPLEVAWVLGCAPPALPGPVAAAPPPAWLRAELVAAAGPAGAVRRGELTRRARPFEPDGFPVPLDRRRLSGKVLAWSAAAVVVVALGLLVGLPTKGNAGPAALEASVLAATPPTTAPAQAPVPAAATGEPLPTLASLGTPAPATVAPESGAGDPAPPPSAAGGQLAPPAAPSARPQARTDAADRGSRTGAIALSWTPAAAPACGGRWTARLHASTGGVDVAKVVAVALRGGGMIQLHRDGDGWSGDLAGLPTDRAVTVTVFADGALRPASARLDAHC